MAMYATYRRRNSFHRREELVEHQEFVTEDGKYLGEHVVQWCSLFIGVGAS